MWAHNTIADVDPIAGNSEIHISSDIVVMARRHWWQTRNVTWLREVVSGAFLSLYAVAEI